MQITRQAAGVVLYFPVGSKEERLVSRAMLSLPGEQSARVDHRNEKKEFFGDWIQTRAAF